VRTYVSELTTTPKAKLLQLQMQEIIGQIKPKFVNC